MASFRAGGADTTYEFHSRTMSLSDDDLHLITQVNESISTKVVEELEAAYTILSRTVSPPVPLIEISPERERKRHEQALDEELSKLLSRSKLHTVGVRAVISAVLPESPVPIKVAKYSKGTTPGARLLSPGKLVKMEHVPVGLVPTKEFIESLTGGLRSSIERKSHEKGQEVLDTFHREIKLHVNKARLSTCDFKMLEEDYLWTPAKDKKLITSFDWKCSKCGARHAIQVLI